MYRPSTIPYQKHRGFSRTFTQGHLSLGLFFPMEAFDGDTPSMLNQVTLAKQAEALGFCALWFRDVPLRDVPLRDPAFGDVGQVFDPWVYLGYMAAHTSEIALGTASIAIPLHHPLHTAKASASVDQLSTGRLILGGCFGRSASGVFGVWRRSRKAWRDLSRTLRSDSPRPQHQF